jgi:hypothetical protein
MNTLFHKIYTISVSLICLNSAHATLINGFGSSELSASDGSVFASQSTTTTTYSGFDNGNPSFIGLFATPADITANPNALVLSATKSTSVSSSFTLTLYDGNFVSQSYTGSWGSFTTGIKQDVILSVSLINGAFIKNNVVGMDISFGGTGDALSVTFDSLSTAVVSPIPEPSTFAALGGAAVLGLAIMRRRRQAA